MISLSFYVIINRALPICEQVVALIYTAIGGRD